MREVVLRWMKLLCWCCGLLGFMPSVWAQVLQAPTPNAEQCMPNVVTVHVAQGAAGVFAHQQPPVHSPPSDEGAWQPVTLPDAWYERWPEHDGSVWYRVTWQMPCLPDLQHDSAQQLAFFTQRINMAGVITINGEQLWRDVSLVEPLSMGALVSRYWPIPNSMLREGRNEMLVRVVGLASQSAGLGRIRLDDLTSVQAYAKAEVFQMRTLFQSNMILSGCLGLLFLLVWIMRRQEHAYGWFALTSFMWVAYIGSTLMLSPWPLHDSLTFARMNMTFFVSYCALFCVFTWRFGEQHFGRWEQVLWALLLVGYVVIWFTPETKIRSHFLMVWAVGVLGFMGNCIQFVVHAWRRGEQDLRLLASLWLLFLLVAVKDASSIVGGGDALLWTPFSSLLTSLLMSLLLAWRLTRSMRRIESFNSELEQHVSQARAELATTLQREHQQALTTAKLQERLEISHDLHDGLGGSLVRAMAFVEQSNEQLENQRVLSLFKVLRDDLRQMIDHGSSSNVVVPDSPLLWVAPLRHRFTRLFDAMEVRTRWEFPDRWRAAPSALQCLGMTRVLEEALSNVIKHSQASLVTVSCHQPEPTWLVLEVKDDGVGFDVPAVQGAGLSVGMRSMTARAERMQGKLFVSSDSSSSEHGTCVRLVLVVPDPSAGDGQRATLAAATEPASLGA